MLRLGLIAVTVMATGGARAASTAPKMDRYASTLFTYTFDSERDAVWRTRHTEAIRYVHSLDKAELASELNDVLRRRDVDSPEGAGAAYLMALHGVDTQKNLHLLIAAHQNAPETVDDSLPDALADIAIRAHSSEAARALVAMPNGDYDQEMQAIAIHKLFLASPELLVSSIADSPALTKTFLELLPFGASNAETSMATAKRVAGKMETLSTGAKRAIYQRIVRMRDYTQ